MQIVFSQVPDDFKDNSDFVENGEHFYNKLIVEDEPGDNGVFKIVDTCDRYVPFDYKQLDELILVLQALQAYRNDKREFHQYWSQVFSK